ncbi:MAG: hypothetical protein PHF70_13195, partial [Opitutales bacterium]|nr:hypothetical protein [Opitutales bacterium]
MNFPDQKHLLQLQKELWSWPRSRVAVMVGAGLSLNAERLPGVQSRIPTWRELVRTMYQELHPLSSDSTSENEDKREADFRASNPLRFASEY